MLLTGLDQDLDLRGALGRYRNDCAELGTLYQVLRKCIKSCLNLDTVYFVEYCNFIGLLF